MKIDSKKINGDVTLYTVSNGSVSFSALDYGCCLTKILVPSKNGSCVDILLGFDDFSGYEADFESFGAIVGRVANRISGASFTLDGKTYNLDKNNGSSCLHGGNLRYGKVMWNAEPFSSDSESSLRFTRRSADGEQGLPGNLDLTVTYTLTDESELILEYTAKTDKATPINITNHAYFNLDGSGSVLSHHLQLDCDEFLKASADLTPTGDVASVSGTAFDFRTEKTIGRDIEKLITEKVADSNTALTEADSPFGYDHCFITHGDESKVVRLGEVWSEKSGIKMEMFTNQRGLHVYTGNFLAGIKGKGGVVHKRHDAVCFETERYPDAVNHPNFPSCILRPNETYWHKTILKFETTD